MIWSESGKIYADICLGILPPTVSMTSAPISPQWLLIFSRSSTLRLLSRKYVIRKNKCKMTLTLSQRFRPQRVMSSGHTVAELHADIALHSMQVYSSDCSRMAYLMRLSLPQQPVRILLGCQCNYKLTLFWHLSSDSLYVLLSEVPKFLLTAPLLLRLVPASK